MINQDHMVTLDPYSKSDILSIFKKAAELKYDLRLGRDINTLHKKTIAMIFEKPSARTRTSFEVAMVQLGGHSIFVQQNEIGMANRESIGDLAKNYSRFVDGVVIRAKQHDDIVQFANHASIPVINGLSDSHHPCQGLTDVFTAYEKFGSFDFKVAYIGEYNNVSRSLALVCEKIGIDFVLSSPEQYLPKKGTVSFEIEADPIKAVQGADFIYTDVWASMGQEAEIEIRKKEFADHQVNQAIIDAAQASRKDPNKDVYFMHCLPARRGEEVTDEVMDGKHSIVFDQAENRLHVQKAVLVALLKNEKN